MRRNLTPNRHASKEDYSTSSVRQEFSEENLYLEILSNKDRSSDSDIEILSLKKDVTSRQLENQEDQQGNKDQEKDQRISLDDLSNETFSDRTELTLYIRGWASEKNFQVVLNTREQKLKKDNTKITILECNTKGCSFSLEFRSNKESEEIYKLHRHYAKHNHKLNLKHNALEFTPTILKKLKELKCVNDDTKAITQKLNRTFHKEFDTSTVWYQLRKIKDLEFGNPTNDSNILMTFLERDMNERRTIFYKEVDSSGKLLHFCFMTNRMQTIANKFYDVIIIDASHKTKRFGMPLLDIITIDNLGKSCTIFVALLQNQKYEEFKWALECFEKNVNNSPLVIFTDEEEALRKGNCL